jgi:hypothetical protein
MKTPRGYYVLRCHGGRSPRTGKPTGSRHRWTFGRCDYCSKFFPDVIKPNHPKNEH